MKLKKVFVSLDNGFFQASLVLRHPAIAFTVIILIVASYFQYRAASIRSETDAIRLEIQEICLRSQSDVCETHNLDYSRLVPGAGHVLETAAS